MSQLLLPRNIEKIGHYTVNDQVYFYKKDALAAAKTDVSQIKYHYNDKLFDYYDWTKEPEPEVPIQDFYLRRAQQLREKYDYIILMFSGGPDSTNMLETFVDNQIHIDEIVNINSYDRTQVVDNTVHNADYMYNVRPVLGELQKAPNFKTRITILDEIDLVQSHWRFNDGQDSIEHIIMEPSGINMFITKPTWVRYVPRLWKMIQDGVRVGVVNGGDKPRLKLINGQYTTSFVDINHGSYGFLSGHDNEFKELDIFEYFYLSADMPSLVIKMVQLLKKFANTHTSSEFYQPDPPKSRPAQLCYSKLGYGNLRYDVFHKVVYPKWKPRFVTPKPTDGIIRQEDCFFLNKLDDQYQKIFKYGFDQYWKQNKKIVFSGPHKGIPWCETRPRFLE